MLYEIDPAKWTRKFHKEILETKPLNDGKFHASDGGYCLKGLMYRAMDGYDLPVEDPAEELFTSFKSRIGKMAYDLRNALKESNPEGYHQVSKLEVEYMDLMQLPEHTEKEREEGKVRLRKQLIKTVGKFWGFA